MKSTGIVRKVDDLGRIVLPVELRRLLELDDRAEVEIYTEGDTVVLKKHRPSCIRRSTAIWRCASPASVRNSCC